MYLENIPNRTTSGKRLGRGYGSGVGGHTSTRGSKGQKSRAGHKSLVFFEVVMYHSLEECLSLMV